MMFRCLLSGSLLTILGVLSIPLSTQAQSLDCSQYKQFGPRSVGACIDLKIEQQKAFERQVTRDVRRTGVPADISCGVYQAAGPRAVGACIDAKLRSSQRIDRAVAEDLRAPLNYDYRYNSGGGYQTPTNHCDRIIHGQCYRRRY